MTNKENKKYFDDFQNVIWMNQMIKSFSELCLKPLCTNGLNYERITEELFVIKKVFDVTDYQRNYVKLYINLCKCGFTETIKLLLKDPRMDPSVRDNKVFIFACRWGTNAEIVKILLNDHRVDPTARDNECFIDACFYGHIEIIKLLLKDPRVNPCARNNFALIESFCTRRMEIVKLLLSDSRVNLRGVQYNRALSFAYLFNRTEIIELLEDYKKNN
jgi:ankyrin repeat protein